MKTGESAFPHDEFKSREGTHVYAEIGVTIRDYFAAKAMQALMSACDSDGKWTGAVPDYVAKLAYETADAMLEARDK